MAKEKETAKEVAEETVTMTRSELSAFMAEEFEKLKDSIKAEADQSAIPAGNDDPWLNEEVEIQLFKDGKDYADDVFVQVNGHSWAIKRGIPVKVPRYVKLQLDNTQRQLMSSAEYQHSQQQEFRDASIRFNL